MSRTVGQEFYLGDVAAGFIGIIKEIFSVLREFFPNQR